MARTGNKNIVFGLLLITFVLISVSLYANLDSGSRNEAISRTGELKALKQQVDEMNKQLLENREAMKKMEEELEQAEKLSKRKKIENENIVYDQKAEAEAEIVKNVDQLEGDADHKAVEDEHDGKQVVPEPVFRNKVAVVHNSRIASNKDVCRLTSNFSHTQSDLQMLDIYDVLSFDNPDGGVWKQGWEVKYTAEEEANNQLKVIVIPHSHCDPGWIKTFEQYYTDQTREILSGMARHLKDKPDMKFIYAEMSFFELWWREQTPEVRDSVKKMLRDGQFEIVTGGWVMTDEANAHYYSIVTELFEGHEWLKNHADFVPNSHWSIDPFGLSPTLPFLLSAANITNAAIQRVHYSVKKHLAKNKQLEFMWRQLWGGKKDVRTHMFPFYSYDIPHTCGPEPRICCQFDFNRLPGGGHSCPWNVPPRRIDDNNIEERAFALYDQYRKKSQLYKTNVLLIPLGDDFRYASDFEWNEQHDNYKKLMAYMNSKSKWNVKASFGTLSDYFKALSEELEREHSSLPTLTGDFFTYADRDDHYWSGYFTSRPFYKQMDRVLQHYVRSADIAYTLSQLNGFDTNEVFDDLVRARRALSLFQHHDGVTGTAKDAVVIDYGQKMLDALFFCEKALSKSLGQQLGISSDLKMHEIREEQDELPSNRVFRNGDALVVFNSLGRTRTAPICITVSNNNLVIDGVKTNDQQIAPTFKLDNNKLVTVADNFELCFVHPIKPLSSQVFRVVQGDTSIKSKVLSNVEALHPDFSSELINGDVVLKNDMLEAIFDGSTGYVKSVTPQGSSVVNVEMKFMHYGARPHKRMNNGGGDDLSGAYLFLPDGEASEVNSASNEVVALSGPVFNKVILAGPKDGEVFQVSTLFRGSPSIDFSTEVDIRSKSNYELAMRFISSVNSGDDLYTDLNGLQLIRRKRMLSKLPLQAHFYPMPSSAFIEDSSTRLTLLGAQALGAASLKSGHLEVMLDRRLNQDDGRGLFQGVLDNKRTLSKFRLLVEPLSKSNEDVNARVGFLSSPAHLESQEIHYPWIRMMGKDVLTAPSFVGLKDEPNCDVHVVGLRTSAQAVDYDNKPTISSKNEAALILFRPMVDCRSSIQLPLSCGSKSYSVEFKSLLSNIKNAQSSSLTMLYEGESLTNLEVQPQEINTIKLMW